MTHAVYAGTFDPPTIGHQWMVEQGASLFGRLTVAIGTNPAKECLLPVESRVDMLRASTRSIKNVAVEVFSNRYLIEYARTTGAGYILRGIRSESDYEYERAMRNINADLDASVTTIFLMPPRDIAEVSSSMVKALIGPEGWEKIVKKYLPEPVFESMVKAVHDKGA